jgi:hypothetical protein
MCEITDQIKFCTCAKGHYSKLSHYWLYYRVGEKKESIMKGTAIIPDYLSMPDYIENQYKLLERLNNPDAFDIEIHPKEGDLMEIVLNNLGNSRAEFHFIFQDSSWDWENHNPFEVLNHHIKKLAKGPIC